MMLIAILTMEEIHGQYPVLGESDDDHSDNDDNGDDDDDNVIKKNDDVI